jgi:hypothetical protein
MGGEICVLGGSELAKSANDRLGFCPRCGEFLKEEMIVCPKCGLIIKEAIPPLEPIFTSPMEVGSVRSTIGAVCLIISGLVGISMSSFVVMNQEAIVANIVSIYGMDLATVHDTVIFLAAFWFISGIWAFVGGLFAYRRRHFRIAVMGGIFALGTFGLIFLEGSIMGLIGLILILLSRREFR